MLSLRYNCGLGYTWHESEDMHTGYLVKTKIHNSVAHCGGIEKLQYMPKTNESPKTLEKLKLYNALKRLQGV